MFRVSLGSNPGEDHPETYHTANPWADAMDVDSIDTNTLNPKAGTRRPRYHPRVDSTDDSDSGSPTATKSFGEDCVQPKVRLQEVDHSQRLREELQQTKASLTEVSRQNEELAVRLPK